MSRFRVARTDLDEEDESQNVNQNKDSQTFTQEQLNFTQHQPALSSSQTRPPFTQQIPTSFSQQNPPSFTQQPSYVPRNNTHHQSVSFSQNNSNAWGGQGNQSDNKYSSRWGSQRDPWSPPAPSSVPAIELDFYHPTDYIANMPQQEALRLRSFHQISLQDRQSKREIFGPKWNPIPEFEHLRMPDFAIQMLRERGFVCPTPIQMQAWPILYASLDVIGIAETGSGKTLAYLLPGLLHVLAQQPLTNDDGPVMLVICPTRELADQIYTEAMDFTLGSEIQVAVAFGGTENRRQQIVKFRNQPDVVIATPGRFKDFVENGITSMNRVSYFVLDEADRLLDMGFREDIFQFAKSLRLDCQRLMFSATWSSRSIDDTADVVFGRSMGRKEPVRIIVGDLNESSGATNKNIRQELFCSSISYGEKFNLLKSDFLPTIVGKKLKTLIFCNTKADCEALNMDLQRLYGSRFCVAIHGDVPQPQRLFNLSKFKKGECLVMVGTDVLARGIDVSDIAIILNFSLPKKLEDYNHRIGRTGRAGRQGTALSFVEKNCSYLSDLVKIVKRAPNHSIPQPILSAVGL